MDETEKQELTTSEVKKKDQDLSTSELKTEKKDPVKHNGKVMSKTVKILIIVSLFIVAIGIVSLSIFYFYSNNEKDQPKSVDTIESKVEDSAEITTEETLPTPSTVTKIPHSGVEIFYNDSTEIEAPTLYEEFYGQDAHYVKNVMSYTSNPDGTVTDNVTGLIWTKEVDPTKVSLIEAEEIAREMSVGGNKDWRVPTIKELYSLIDFKGYTGKSVTQDMTTEPENAVPFIDTNYFDFRYGDTENNERYIDAQWLSSTKYVSTTMNGAETLFGVNFADGRIKGYGYSNPKRPEIEKKFYARYVRGDSYGENQFVIESANSIKDNSTGLIWQKGDSMKGLDWKNALEYCEDLLLDGNANWRVPNTKELQYIVDYRRSPLTTSSPAIDSKFESSSIIDENGLKDYPYYWTGTTHLDGPNPGKSAAYICFGQCQGEMNGEVMDVHGAGAQRSDPKSGSQLDYPDFFGPQGDVRYVYNYVRCVRDRSY